MATIYDPIALRAIVKVASFVLHKHFFYSNDDICWFIDAINDNLLFELGQFRHHADKNILAELEQEKAARFQFTLYFTHTYVKKFFIDEMNFSEQEIQAYENILPKYIGDALHEPTSPSRA